MGEVCPLGVLIMRVSQEWLKCFNVVMDHHRKATPLIFGDAEVEECKAEAREHEEWAIGYYPWAAAIIQETNSASST